MKKSIQILVDRDCDPPHHLYARTSLWKSFLGKLDCSSEFEISEISISDRKTKAEEVRIDEAQVVIINWDAANGDFICGSDDVFLYFQTQRDKFDALLRRPGRIICEIQCGSGMLFQGAYDAVFGPSEVKVVEAKLRPESWPEDTKEQERKTKEEEQWTNVSASVNRSFRKHPLLVALSRGKVESTYGPNKQRLFNFNKKAQIQFFAYRQRDTIYRGWFEHWGKEWVPLLIADPRKERSFLRSVFSPPRTVLLAKSHEGGLLIASTMWLAVPGAEDLVRQILTVDPKRIAEAHKGYFFWRMLLDFCVGLPVTLIVGFGLMAFVNELLKRFASFIQLLHFPSFLYLNWFLAPYLNWSIAEDLGAVWWSLILYRFWQSTIRHRPHGVRWLQFLKSGLKRFGETF